MNRIVLIIVALHLESSVALTQNATVSWSAFDNGFAIPVASNTRIQSLVGQVAFGSTRQGTELIESGFLSNPLLRGVLVGVRDYGDLPLTFSLSQNYPNPFNPTTTIAYSIPVGTYGRTSLRVYDMLGREVTTLMNEVKQPGNHSILWDARDMASGVYFYRLEAGTFVQTKKMILIR